MVQANASLIVDRGLPDQNLNNAAGADRSNISWAFAGDFLAGDDFVLAALDPGQDHWRIDRLTVWVVGGESTLGDRFNSISLFLGPAAASIPAVASANLTGNSTDNADVAVSQVTYPGGAETYQALGGELLNIWQIDFFNLGLFDAGLHLFALGGEGPAVTFMHASNAALSGTPQDGADDLYHFFTGNALDADIDLGGSIDSDGNRWDKSSDINIQVYATQESATQVSEPGVFGLMGLGLLAVTVVRRRVPRA
jgi:hypothetical protein